MRLPYEVAAAVRGSSSSDRYGQDPLPARPASMTLDRDRPEILTPPEHPQACCTRQIITVPPGVNAKTL